MQVPPCTRIKNGEEVEYFPLASMVLGCHPSNSGSSRSLEGDSNNNFYLKAVKTQSGRDLVEEFVATNVYPLRSGWGFAGFSEKKIPMTS